MINVHGVEQLRWYSVYRYSNLSAALVFANPRRVAAYTPARHGVHIARSRKKGGNEKKKKS